MKQSKKIYPIANKNLDVPEKTLLLYALKEYKVYVGKLQSEIDDLQYKNSILIEKGKSLERELKKANKQKESLEKELIREKELKNSLKLKIKEFNESLKLTESEEKEIRKAVRKEDLYNRLTTQIKVLIEQKKVVECRNKKLENENDYLIFKLVSLQGT